MSKRCTNCGDQLVGVKCSYCGTQHDPDHQAEERPFNRVSPLRTQGFRYSLAEPVKVETRNE